MTTKPRLRFRYGRWTCSGRGHKGTGKTMHAAYRTWNANRIYAATVRRIRGRVGA